MHVVVLGATGMLGAAVYRLLGQDGKIRVSGIARSETARALPQSETCSTKIVQDFLAQESLETIFAEMRPDVVINCIGVVKQLADSHDPLVAIPINALLPHRLSRLCADNSARLVHVSTDCVFSGSRGNYSEADIPDARDLYGLSKYLGEVSEPHAVTLRTSIIGHELNSKNGVVEWFLAQKGRANGYTKAIFSGLPTVELARVIRDFVLPAGNALRGLYHVSAAPISKHDLLTLVAKIYGKEIELAPVDTPVIDRSLNSIRFRDATGYNPPEWGALIKAMHTFG